MQNLRALVVLACARVHFKWRGGKARGKAGRKHHSTDTCAVHVRPPLICLRLLSKPLFLFGASHFFIHLRSWSLLLLLNWTLCFHPIVFEMSRARQQTIRTRLTVKYLKPILVFHPIRLPIGRVRDWFGNLSLYTMHTFHIASIRAVVSGPLGVSCQQRPLWYGSRGRSISSVGLPFSFRFPFR